MAISAKELAKKLNISPATVSMVLNKKPGISERTREMVLSAALEYGYELPKKSEKTNSGIIQFVIYKKNNTESGDTPFFSHLIEGINTGCKNEGCELQISYFYENQDPGRQITSLAEKNCQGILLLGSEMSPDAFQPFRNLNLPIVLLDTYFEDLNCDMVSVNNVQGAYLAVNHLLERGFQQIGYLHSSCSAGNFNERAEGYYKALYRRNLPLERSFTHELPPTLEGAYNGVKRLLEAGLSPLNAYFADNDLIAAGAMRAFKEAGYRIPDDISLVGYDHMPICDFLEPKLTTMAVPAQNLGELAVTRLFDRIRHPEYPAVKLELSAHLTPGSSVSSPKKKKS